MEQSFGEHGGPHEDLRRHRRPRPGTILEVKHRCEGYGRKSADVELAIRLSRQSAC